MEGGTRRARKARAISFKRSLGLLGTLVLGLSTAVGSAGAAVPFVDIGAPSGPLTRVAVGTDLSCQAQHTGDTRLEFFPSSVTPGDCGTFLVRRAASCSRPTSPITTPASPVSVARHSVHRRRPERPHGRGHGLEPLQGRDQRQRRKHRALARADRHLHLGPGVLSHRRGGQKRRRLAPGDHPLPRRRLLPAGLRHRVRVHRRERRGRLLRHRQQHPARAHRGMGSDHRGRELPRGALRGGLVGDLGADAVREPCSRCTENARQRRRDQLERHPPARPVDDVLPLHHVLSDRSRGSATDDSHRAHGPRGRPLAIVPVGSLGRAQRGGPGAGRGQRHAQDPPGRRSRQAAAPRPQRVRRRHDHLGDLHGQRRRAPGQHRCETLGVRRSRLTADRQSLPQPGRRQRGGEQRRAGSADAEDGDPALPRSRHAVQAAGRRAQASLHVAHAAGRPARPRDRDALEHRDRDGLRERELAGATR